MTPGGDDVEVLVCVYYRVGAADSARAISTVREIQRRLRERFDALRTEVLLRCELPVAAPSPDALPVPTLAPDNLPAAVPDAADATLMETYRLAPTAPAGSPGAATALREFMDALDASSGATAGLLRGTRHVELFASCAS